jgi:hypothetical protein
MLTPHEVKVKRIGSRNFSVVTDRIQALTLSSTSENPLSRFGAIFRLTG